MRVVSLLRDMGKVRQILKNKWAKWGIAALLSPLLLFLLLFFLLYLPPVQNYVVDRVCESLSDSTGLSFSVDRVRLSFPLDLSVRGVKAEQRGDSVLRAEELLLSLEFWPLLEGQANVNGLKLRDAGLTTRDLVSNTQIIGSVKELTAELHGVNWKENHVNVDDALLSDADLMVLLCDTAAEDTTKSAPWVIDVAQAVIKRTELRLTMPGDSLHLFTRLGLAELKGGHFDTGEPLYQVASLDIEESRLHYDAGWGSATASLAFQRKEINNDIQGKSLDPSHLYFEELHAQIREVKYDERGVLHASLKKLCFREANTGFLLSNLAAHLYYDAERVRVSELSLTTPYSNVSGHVSLMFSALDMEVVGDGGGLDADLTATLGWEDVKALSQGYLPDALWANYPHYDVTIGAKVAGSLRQLQVEEARLGTPYSQLLLSGSLRPSALMEGRNYTTSAEDLNLRVQSRIGWQDVNAWGRPYLPATLANNYPRSNLMLNSTVRGNMSQLRLDNLLFLTSTGTRLSGNLSANLLALTNGYGISQDVFSGRIQSRIAASDIRAFGAPFMPADIVRQLPPYDLTLNTALRGNPDHIAVSDLMVQTPYSRISGNAEVWPAALASNSARAFNADLKTSIGWADLERFGGSFIPADIKGNLPRGAYELSLNASGSLANVKIGKVALGIPGMGTISGDGNLAGLLAGNPSGTMNVSFTGKDMTLINKLLPPDVAQTVRIPNNLQANGKLGFSDDSYLADLLISQDGGTAKIKANVNMRRETYIASVLANAFPLQNFLPTTGLQRFTGTMNADGSKFDVVSAAARLVANAEIEQLGLDSLDLGGLRIEANNSDGLFTANFHSQSDLLEGNGTLSATLGDNITGSLNAKLPFADLGALARMDETMQAGANIDLTFHALQDFSQFGFMGTIRNMHFSGQGMSFMGQDMDMLLETSQDTTYAHAESGDLYLDYQAQGSLLEAVDAFTLVADTISAQVKASDINIYGIRDMLPTADITLVSGKKNPLTAFLKAQGMGYDKADIHLVSSPTNGLGGHVYMTSFYRDKLMLDSIHAVIVNDSSGLALDGMIHNFKRKNPNKFEAKFKAYVHPHGAGIEAAFRDKDGNLGLDLGALANLEPDGYRLHLYPDNPVIAYRTFTVNPDNYAFYGLDGTSIGANIDLLADDGTGLRLYGEPNDSLVDITLSLSRVNLGELSVSVPYVPLMRGMLTGDVHLTDDHNSVSALADIHLDDFVFQGTELGNLGIEGIYLPKDSSQHYAQAFVNVDEQEVMSLEGTYFAESEAFQADGQLNDFPLQLINGFISGTGVALRGTGVGSFDVSGTVSKPILNGSLDFIDGHIYSDTYGFDFRTDSVPVIIDHSRLTFNNYNLWSTGSNPLKIDGALDMSDLSNVAMNFDILADDFELINSKRKRESTVYGKAYVDFDGTLRGGTRNGITMRGNVSILPKTDLVYILRDSPLTVDNQLDGLVTFVSFEDSLDTDDFVVEDESGGFEMTLGVDINEAAHFLCNLSEDGKSYVDINGGGSLTLRQTRQGDTRLVGRLTVQKGEMKYELPVIPLKTFTIEPGSYVDFKGDIGNPTLSIVAKERVKAIVTENDQQRSVAFDVGVDISKTVQDMGLKFLIDAPEDLIVQNQLTAMGADQRNKAAVAMLATGMYLTDNNSSGFRASNALNAFLQSEIQNIAGNALRTIDINLGVEAGTSSKGTNTTDYSFQFSKRFWGDRVSVIIGGRISAGVDADNSAESFINNVAIEYRLDQGSTKLLKLFYNRDTQDPLEGQLAGTGAGIVLRKKSDRLGELFIFSRKKDK